MAVTYPFDARPKWAEQKFNQTNEAIGAILKNPMLIAEGMAQQISDTFEEKGAAYCIGYAAGDFFGGKGIDKLAKISKAKVLGKSDAADDIGDVVKVADSGLDETRTVWDNIKATQAAYEGTSIPKSFNIKVGEQEFWINPNGTKHMLEYVTSGGKNIATKTASISSQEMLTEFQAAFIEAINKNGIVTDKIIRGGDWEFILSAPREPGMNVVVKHARYNP